jgi:hypothetical protein
MRKKASDNYMEELAVRGHRQIATSLKRRLKRRELELKKELKARLEEELVERLGQDEEALQIRQSAEALGIDLSQVRLMNRAARSVEADEEEVTIGNGLEE